MNTASFLMIVSASVAASSGAQKSTMPTAAGQPYGSETVITFAGGGALREWQRGPNGAGHLFVKNRTEQWYRVELTGPCRLDRPLDTLSYTTDSNGVFDRFSRIRIAHLPGQLCGVRSIRRSTPPPSRVGTVRRPPAR